MRASEPTSNGSSYRRTSTCPGGPGRFARKPVLGVAGDRIAIIQNGTTIFEREAVIRAATGGRQRFVALPRVAIAEAQEGSAEGHAIVTCFVANGVPLAVGMRLGGTHYRHDGTHDPARATPGAPSEIALSALLTGLRSRDFRISLNRHFSVGRNDIIRFAVVPERETAGSAQ